MRADAGLDSATTYDDEVELLEKRHADCIYLLMSID